MKHIHKYIKKDLSRTDKPYLVYKCQVPACHHYIPIVLAEGKLCICNECLEPFVITKVTLTASSHGPAAKPKCNKCIKHKRPINEIGEFLKDKGL